MVVKSLPVDFFHLLSDELADRLDFATLYNCIVSSKHIASSGAINALYRISHQAPIKGGGEGLPFSEQELLVQKWTILWRTIILSALDNSETSYPYCKHLRFLDLRDLSDLLDDDKFRNKTLKKFFSGKLNQYHHVIRVGKRRVERLDIKRIVAAIGDVITEASPLLEQLSEPSNSNVFSVSLPEWAPRLANLTSLDLWDGNALAGDTVQNLLHVHCPRISSLRVYQSPNQDADHVLASFIGGMPENSLIYFENISDCRIGAETFLALNHHGKSLRSLKLALDAEIGVLNLGLLQGCTAIETLALACFSRSADLQETQHDIYLQITGWLRDCKALNDISFTNFVSAPDILLPVLISKDIKLEKLQINASDNAMYVASTAEDFHQALSLQPTLQSLILRADPEPVTGEPDYLTTLVNTLCLLKDLKELRLHRISEYFTDVHIRVLAMSLPNLGELYVGGYNITDKIFDQMTKLEKLKVVDFQGITTFTEDGILKFIDRLGEGNRGLFLSVDNADPDRPISADSQEVIRDAIATKLNGRFEYQLLRGMWSTLTQIGIVLISYRSGCFCIRFGGFRLRSTNGIGLLSKAVS